jgi:nitrate ABC transporter permease subunit
MTATRDRATVSPSRPLSATAEKQLPPAWFGHVEAVLYPTLAIVAVGAAWEALAAGGLTGQLPAPSRVFADVQPLVSGFFNNDENDKGVFWQLAASLGRVALGYSLAAVVGVSLGILVGALRPLRLAFDPLFQVLRTIPPLAWLPIALATVSQANPSAIFVIFITAIWPILINTAVGVRQTPQDYRNVAAVLNLSKTAYFFKILLPSAASYIFTGLRIAIGLAWLAIVAAEGSRILKK